MERPVKTNLPFRLLPVSEGWALLSAESLGQTFVTLAEAVTAIPPESVLQLELPCRAVVFEQMSLPSTDPAELLDMARLQLEKTLPFTRRKSAAVFRSLKSRRPRVVCSQWRSTTICWMNSACPCGSESFTPRP
ncbi:MAG: hypothetical protein QM796_11985 [Chthoniobacteraceae bacterium]